MSILDSILENHSNGARIVGENHNLQSININGGAAADLEARIRNVESGGFDESEYRKTKAQYIAELRVIQGNPAALAKLDDDMRQRAIRRASLDTSNGRVNVMVAGALPWHGLGVNVEAATNSRDAIRLAGMDWEVAKRQLAYPGADGTWIPATDAYGIVRTDTQAYLGTVGKRYAPIQNVQGFDFLDGLLEEFGARYESAGSLYGGEKVWMLAHLPAHAFRVNGDDLVEPYVIFENCHDGSGSALCFPTSVRVVCANTFRTATSSRERAKSLSIRHTGNVRDKLAAAREALGIAVQGFSEFKDGAEAMAHKPLEITHYAHDVLDAVLEVTQADALKGADVLAASLAATSAARDLARKSFARKIEQRSEILEDILTRYETSRNGENGMRGSAWSAFNAITDFADHGKLGKQASDPDVRASRRFESALTGDADEMKQIAYSKALA